MTQQLCEKVVDNYLHALEFVPDCYITQKMCDKAVITYPSTIEYVPYRFKSQEICDKAVKRCFFAFDSIPDWYKTQEMFDIFISFLIAYYLDKNKTQKRYDEAVADCLAVLKFIPDWFVASKMLEKLDNALHANDDILLHNKILIKSYDTNNNFDEDDPDIIIHVRLLAWCSKFKKRKALKERISDELITIAWHPERWRNVCMPEDEKKEIEPIFTE